MYKTSSTTFSQGRKQKKDFDIDFYDDAIVDFDTYIHDLFTNLEESGKLNNTVVIIYSDHPRARAAYQHTPLLFWFPNGQYAGQITSNTQNMDIAPTILDYLGEPIPQWMEGVSLLKGNPSPERPIYSVLWKDPKKNKLPNQTLLKFGDLRMIICNQFVEFSSEDMQWHSGEVMDKSSACEADLQLTIDKMKEILIKTAAQRWDRYEHYGRIPLSQILISSNKSSAQNKECNRKVVLTIFGIPAVPYSKPEKYIHISLYCYSSL